MASTPDTSFSRDESFHRVPRKAAQHVSTLSKLPSPQRSEQSDHTHEDDTEDVLAAYRVIWDSFCGLPYLAEDEPTFHLEQASYDQLYQRLSEHPGLLQYFEDDIRKDWSHGRLTLKLMATRMHDIFEEELIQAIKEELDRIAKRKPSLRPFRQKIRSAGHSKVERKGGTSTRAPIFDKSPDGQLLYQSALYPPFLFEIAYSQTGHSLYETVKEFFEHAPGKICTILAIDIEYAEPEVRIADDFHHVASVSLWTSSLDADGDIDIHCSVNARRFRDSDGIHLQGQVAIPFSAFVPIASRARLPLAAQDSHAEVRLDFAQLAEFVHIAEIGQRTSDKGVTPAPSTSSPSPPPAPQPKKLKWLDEQGNITGEKKLEPKRRPVQSPSGLSVRTRSASRRRSERVRSSSRNRNS